MKQVLSLIDKELTRAEAVVKAANGNRKLHGPTTDHHRGQAFALEKVKFWIEQSESYPEGPTEVHKIVTIRIPWKTVAFVTILLMIFATKTF